MRAGQRSPDTASCRACPCTCHQSRRLRKWRYPYVLAIQSKGARDRLLRGEDALLIVPERHALALPEMGRGAILDEAINDALPKLYIQALQENHLEPLAQPEIEVTRLEDNEALQFTAEVDVKPADHAARLTTTSARRVPRRRRERHRRGGPGARRSASASPPSSTVDRPAEDGGFVVIDLTATQGRRARRGRPSWRGMSYKVGRGGMLDGLDEALAGSGAPARTRPSRPSWWAATCRRGRRGSGQGDRCSGGSFPTRRGVRPDGLGVRHRRRAVGRRPGAARVGASASSRPPPPATPCSRPSSRGSTYRCPRHRHRQLNARRQNVEQQLITPA